VTNLQKRHCQNRI